MGRAAVSGGDAAFRCLHKRDVLVGNRMSCERLQSGDALGVWLAVAHQNPVDRARHLDVRRTRAAAAHADAVVAADIIGGGHRVKRTDILTCATQSADHCASADAGELMNACAAARNHAVADLGVSGEERVVGEHAVARDLNIVGRMRAGHPEITITDAGGAVVAGRAVNRHMFAKAVGIADHDSRAVLGVMEALVLRSEADGNAGITGVSRTHAQRSLQVDIGDENRASPKFDLAAQHAIRADLDIVGERDVARVHALNDGGRVDLRHRAIVRNHARAVRLRVVKTLAEHDQLRVVDLGRVTYADALALQRETHEQLVAGRQQRTPMTVFLLEHDPPVITVTKRVGAAAHVLAGDEMLARHRIERIETDRGGDVTYHGPGQLVAYPILDLSRLGLKVHPYVRWLEQCIIDTLAHDALAGLRDPGATGVWVGADGVPERKIAAIGVRLSRFASLHGFALNVAPNLEHFDLIVPCGLQRPVTSMDAELGEAAPTLDAVKARVSAWFVGETARMLGS